MKKYIIAELAVGISCFGQQLKKALAPYETERDAKPEVLITVAKVQEIKPQNGKIVGKTEKYLEISTQESSTSYLTAKGRYSASRKSFLNCPDERYEFDVDALQAIKYDVDLFEYRSVGFSFSRALVDHGGFCLHASAIAVNNQAILFSGPSNVGKSTHTGLWKQYFGKEKVSVINDDNPAIRLMEDGFYAYGTPFCGSTGINENRKVPLKAIVFLEQAPVNAIERLGIKEASILLFNHTLREKCSEERIVKILELYEVLLKKIPIYKLKCRPDFEAVNMACQEILGESE